MTELVCVVVCDVVSDVVAVVVTVESSHDPNSPVWKRPIPRFKCSATAGQSSPAVLGCNEPVDRLHVTWGAPPSSPNVSWSIARFNAVAPAAHCCGIASKCIPLTDKQSNADATPVHAAAISPSCRACPAQPSGVATARYV